MPAEAIDWPTYAFSGHRDGANPYEQILTPQTVGALQVAWTTDAGVGGFNQPVLADGLLYEGVDDGDIVAMDASTGAVVWTNHIDPDDVIMSGISVANGMVYASGLRGVWAFDAAKGSLMWHSLPRYQTFSPLVSGHRVYVSDDDGTLYSANAVTGRKGWGRLILRGNTFFTLALGGGDVYVTWFGNDVVRVDAVTGKVDGGVSLSKEALGVSWHEGMEYVGTGNGLAAGALAVDPTTDQILWEFEALGTYAFGAPAVLDGVVYLDDSGNDGGHVYALDAATGEMIWTFEAPDGIPGVSVAGGVVYTAGDDDWIRALDAATGELLWSFFTGSRVAHAPIIANGMVYAATGNGQIFAFGLPVGTSP